MFQLALDLGQPVQDVLAWPTKIIGEWQGFYAYKNWLAEREKN